LVFHYLFSSFFLFFLFNDPATTVIYTLSLHDALPILVSPAVPRRRMAALRAGFAERAGWARADPRPDLQTRRHAGGLGRPGRLGDRKSTRLNSSHVEISYAVFCLKKKKKDILKFKCNI